MRIRRLLALTHIAYIKAAVAARLTKSLAFISSAASTRRSGQLNTSYRGLFTSSSPEPTQMNMTREDTSNPLTQQSLPEPLILGSSSFTRKLILREMNIPFHIMIRSIDEKAIGDRTKNPHDLVLEVARAKMDRLVEALRMEDCANELPETTIDGEYVILTGDQVITCDDTILEKPVDVAEAKRFVNMYASNPPSTVGSVVLTHYPSGITVEGTDTATIYFTESVGHIDAASNQDLVDRMLKDDAPILSCAGGLMIEHPMVREHVEKIDGTEDSVMGLSKALVDRLLGELKVKLDER